jgi:hypothetical protein
MSHLMLFIVFYVSLAESIQNKPSAFGLRDGEVVEVWYSDAPFGLPWFPTWHRAVVSGKRLVRCDGQGYFKEDHVIQHLKWRSVLPEVKR